MVQEHQIGLEKMFFLSDWGAYNNDKYLGIYPYYNEDNEFNAKYLNHRLCSVSEKGVCSPDDGHSPTAYV